jgi:regulator of sigma E protease
MPLLGALLASFHSILLVIALVLGFGFVIFFHELGHFLAAKWVGIKVEQFAVGFGQALVCYRKGIGLRVGTTQREYRRRLEEFLQQKHKDDPQIQERSGLAYQQAMVEVEMESGLGETEYRLNWIPLGGYVKMLGQDDLRPNSEAEDPRSYNKKSIGARMLVVSAGVIMNVILAGAGFTALFMYGFNVPPAWVGSVTSGSPAVNAVRIVNGQRVRTSLYAGDEILEYQGKPQDDFTKIGLYVALSAQGQEQTIKVRHPDGTVEELLVTPQPDPTSNGFLSLGIRQPQMLQGPDPKEIIASDWKDLEQLELPDVQAVKPGETVTQINGLDVDFKKDFWKLSAALQDPHGKPVALTVRDDATRQVRHTVVHPQLGTTFGGGQLYVAGMTPRPRIPGVQPDSAARGKILPGDVVLSITVGSDTPANVDTEQFRKLLLDAGNEGKPVSITVFRDGSAVTVGGLSASTKIDNGKGQKARGLGVQLGYDELHPVVAGIEKDSPAYNAGIPAGATITKINGRKIENWFDIQRELSIAKAGSPVPVDFTTATGQGHKELQLNEDQIAQVAGIRRGCELLLREYMIDRKARNPAQAISWGVTETRDFILQFYLTLRRMFGGSVSPDQLMGPVGIFVNGTRVASKGWDWLVWFLSMISANLAVVNFLPIPIVDGGLFTFLLLEKIQGRPLSPRTQAIAQYVGLAFLAGVFLFVTYHDILRFI